MSIIKKILGTNSIVDSTPAGDLYAWGATRGSGIADLTYNTVNYNNEGSLQFHASPTSLTSGQWKKLLLSMYKLPG